jgi:hypothetical protein
MRAIDSRPRWPANFRSHGNDDRRRGDRSTEALVTRSNSRSFSRLSLRHWAAAALGVTALVGLGSCANEAPARSYVQPNAIKKTDLSGTFYYIQTVTEAPPTNGAMFKGQSSSLLQIRFDIEQNFLYARRAFAQVANSEDAEVSDGPNYMGSPLAAWAITSQFDIIRDYNSTTGEQTNAIIESQERPWNEREFIRVDWSKNLITDYVGLGLDLFFSDGQPSVEGVSYWQSDPTQPDALHMEHLTADQGGLKSGDLTYMDITDEMIVTPELLSIEGMTYPKCFFYYEQDDCASQVVKVRHSFAKIDPTHTYEPRQWDGVQMNLFGVWDVGLRRLSYNTEYGITNTGASRTAARFNIWEAAYKPDGTYIQPKDRVLKKIPYYAEGSMPITYEKDPQFPDGMQDSIYPPDLFPDFQFIVSSWNKAMLTAVQDLTGSPAPHDVFVPCHNPVRSSDDPVCTEGLVPMQDGNGNNILDKQGNPIYRAREGDPRHSCVFWVNEPQAAGPLGYGPPLYDEVTGETISGQAYIYGAALQTYAARSRDLMLLMNGDISETDYVNGANVQQWVAAHKQGVGFTTPAANQALSSLQTFTPQQLLTASRAMDFSWAEAFTPANGYPALDLSSVANLYQSMVPRRDAIYNGFYAYGSPNRDSILARLIDTPLEQMLITPESLAAGGVSPMTSWNDLNVGQKVQVSPLRSAALQKQLNQMKTGAEIRGVDLYEGFTDNGLEQRLRAYQKKYDVAPGGSLAQFSEPMRLDLIHTLFTSVTLHEVGHNMGCRHNFRASYDALNYFPPYWDIRTAGAANPDPGTPPNPTSNPLQLHPRYVNQAGGKITQYEINNQIQEYQYTSVMDYGSEFNSDINGLGMYDKALIKFSYAQYVEVFTDTKKDFGTANNLAALSQAQSAYGFPSPLGAGAGLSAVAYQNLPSLFANGKDSICGLQPADATHPDSWCKYRMDVPYASINNVTVQDPTTGATTSYLGDPQEHALVPYYFCSDEYVGNLTCQRFDSGADAYEQAADIISRYKNFYLLNNFKRDRAKFYTSGAYKDRIASRYFDILREQLVWYTLLRSEFQAELTAQAEASGGTPNQVVAQQNAFFTDENGWGNFTAAVTAGFDLLGQVIVTPEAGIFFKTSDEEGNIPHWEPYGGPGFFGYDVTTAGDPLCLQGTLTGQCAVEGHTVGLLDGKYSTTSWDFNGCGYYWADECQERIGYLLDKEIALDELSQSQAYFTGRDTSTDVRTYAIGYVLPFKQQLEEKVGAILSNDMTSLAPYFTKSTLPANGNPLGAPYNVVNPSWTFDNPSAPKGDPSDSDSGIIDPSVHFTISLYTGVYALSGFPTTFDHDVVDNSKIFVVGNGEAPVPDSYLLDPSNSAVTTDPSNLVSRGGSAQWLIYTDPVNGETFAAHSVAAPALVVPNPNDPSGQTTATTSLRADIGIRMLEQLITDGNQYNTAQTLPLSDPSRPSKVANTQTTFQNMREQVQIMRSLQNAYGYGPYSTTPDVYY